MKRHKFLKRLFISVFLVSLISTVLVTNVVASATITPSSASGLVNMAQQFTASGLDPTDQYSIKLGTTTVLTDQTCSSAGVLTFTVTATSAGTFTVGVYNNASELECSAQLIATDLFATIVPALVILIGISILLGLSKEMGKI